MVDKKIVIGICTAGLDEDFHLKILERVFKELEAREYKVMLFGAGFDLYLDDDSTAGEASIYKLINYKILDAIIMFSATLKQPRIKKNIVDTALKWEVPVISIDEELENCYNVVYRFKRNFEEIVRHVIEYHGMREVNFIAGQEGNEISEERLAVYKKVMDENDLPVEEFRIGYGDFWETPTREVMDKFMDPALTPPEAIICANDSMAIAVCDYLREKNVKVPEDIIVTGFDGIDEGIKHSPNITTCSRDEVNDAKKIVHIVEQLVANQVVPYQEEISYHMQLSQSCGCQEKYLFDASIVIHDINAKLAQDRADRMHFATMSEKLLGCEDMDAYEKIVEEYMPENSIICVNDDLFIGARSKAIHTYANDAFTQNVYYILKKENEITKGSCQSRQIIPFMEEFVQCDEPLIFLPLRYSKRTVGYLGVSHSSIGKNSLEQLLKFCLAYDNSAGYLLSSVE